MFTWRSVSVPHVVLVSVLVSVNVLPYHCADVWWKIANCSNLPIICTPLLIKSTVEDWQKNTNRGLYCARSLISSASVLIYIYLKFLGLQGLCKYFLFIINVLYSFSLLLLEIFGFLLYWEICGFLLRMNHAINRAY